MQTRLTLVLGIQFPIVLPGMSWISTPKLVAAVSEAGGLGVLASGPLSQEETREAIREIRSLTNKPFGVGVSLLMPGAKENAEIALEEKVPVINFSLGKGDWIVKRVREYGGKTIATVVTEEHAQSAVRSGVDALQVTGHEAAAHGGDVTSLVLVPAIASKVDVPVIATGGFADGRGLMAALSLGAEGVAMGSRLATSQESPLHQTTKDAIVSKNESETIYGNNFDGLYARVMKTPVAEKAMKRPMGFIMAALKSFKAAQSLDIPMWKVMAGLLVQFSQIRQLSLFGAAMEKIEAATVDGDLNKGVQFVGQTQGLIEDQPSVQELIERIMQQARAVHEENEKRW